LRLEILAPSENFTSVFQLNKVNGIINFIVPFMSRDPTPIEIPVNINFVAVIGDEYFSMKKNIYIIPT